MFMAFQNLDRRRLRLACMNNYLSVGTQDFFFGVLQLLFRRAQVLPLRTFPRSRLLRTHALRGFSALCGFCRCWGFYGCWPFCGFSDFRASLSKLFLVLSVVKLVELPTSDFVPVYILRGILRHTIPPVGSFFME